MPRASFASHLALALLLAAPLLSRAGDWECSARGGREWREVSTGHFRIATDLSSGKARDLAEELETMHVAVRTALFDSPPPMPGVVRVVAFRDEGDYREFANEKVSAYYVVLEGQPTVVMHGNFAEHTRIVLAHELAHHSLARSFPRQPRWFSEGYACYLETVGANGPNATPTVGGVPPERIFSARSSPERLGRLFAAKGQLPDAGYYGLAWALVHYLIQARGREFTEFQVRLARGGDPDASWRAVFPRWDPGNPEAMKELHRELAGYLRHGRFGYSTIKLVKEHTVEERPLTSAEVHGLRIMLWRRGTPEAVRAADDAEAAEALSEDPGQVTALRYLAFQRNGDGAALGARAVASHPEDARAWLLAAAFATDPAERERAFRKAAELAPEDERALNELAWFLVQAEREGEALPLARKAAGIAPWSPPTLDTYAAALQGLGRCTDALWLERRALEALSEHVTDEGRKPYLDRLARLEASCGSKAPATAPAATPAPGPAAPASAVSSQPRP